MHDALSHNLFTSCQCGSCAPWIASACTRQQREDVFQRVGACMQQVRQQAQNDERLGHCNQPVEIV